MEKRCELYLRLRADSLPAASELELLAREVGPAALLLTHPDSAKSENALQAFVDTAKRQNIAILIEDALELAEALDADGLHLKADTDRLAQARQRLGEGKSIGVSCGLSRHEMMVMAEGGADYIALGELPADGPRAKDERVALIEWWAELFEVPCVAWLEEGDTAEDANRYVQAGADFLCLAFEPGAAADGSERILDLTAVTGSDKRLA